MFIRKILLNSKKLYNPVAGSNGAGSNAIASFFYSKKNNTFFAATNEHDRTAIYQTASTDDEVETAKDAVNKAYYFISLGKDYYGYAHDYLQFAEDLDVEGDFNDPIKDGIATIIENKEATRFYAYF